MVTPDELGDAWKDEKLHLPLITHYNGKLFGEPEAGEDMQFSFAELLAHAAKSRPLAAGTLMGLRHHRQPGHRPRCELPGRKTHARNHRQRQTGNPRSCNSAIRCGLK